MSALLDVCGNDTGSPSISKADDNLSNSDGPLIKGIIRQNSCGSMHASMSMAEKSTKRRYCLWMLTLILAIIGLCNLFLNITVIAVLRISQGMEAMEVIPDENLLKFYGRTDLDKISLQSGICQSYGDEPMEISGDEAGVCVDVKNRGRSYEAYPHSKLGVQPNGTTMSQVESFEIKDPRTGVTYFTTDFPNFGLPNGVKTIDVRIAETHRITSPVNESLAIKSDNEISLHGAEGVRMESKDIAWSADLDIYLKSVNGSVVLDAKDGVFIDVKEIPKAPMFLQSPAASHEQYKVCVCMPQGKLFKVPVRPGTSSRTVNCARVARTPENDPCLH
ncbi:beta-sarcoglycan isoform X2 [Cardiocondyla obscurior]|uniref:beta-sarcoglycan isoform X2 n=1 Tax=Cardiocondyla obscurior TaxID=286306 RepID=UPI00396561D0